MKKIDRVIWTVLFSLQVLVWILHQKAYGTQNGMALIVPLLAISKWFLSECKEDYKMYQKQKKEEYFMNFETGEVYFMQRKAESKLNKLKGKGKVVFLKRINGLSFFKHPAGYMECFSDAELSSGSVVIEKATKRA